MGNTIAALAVQLKEAASPEFKEYAGLVQKNAKALAEGLQKLGHEVVTGGSDNHLVLWDVRPKGLTGSKMEKILDYMHVTVNKNAIYGDKSALSPGGVRLGTAALTTRRMKEADMTQVASLLDRALQIAVKIQEQVGKKLMDFEVACKDNEDIKALDKEVYDMATSFYMPGWDIEGMKYHEA